MTNDRQYDWAVAAAAQLLNHGHVKSDDPKSIAFQKILSVVYDAIRMSEQEAREQMLMPSKN